MRPHSKSESTPGVVSAPHSDTAISGLNQIPRFEPMRAPASATRAPAAAPVVDTADGERSRTQGRATYSMHFARYEEAPRSVSEEIIARVQGATK